MCDVARRIHAFRVPRPDLAVRTGAPDACTDCHAGRDARWAAMQLESRRRAPGAEPTHFSLAFASGEPGALLEVAARRDEAGIVRASALDRMLRD